MKNELVKEPYYNMAEGRGMNSGHKIFQVVADASKPKVGESGKDDKSPWTWE
jgi:hypothetical protein